MDEQIPIPPTTPSVNAPELVVQNTRTPETKLPLIAFCFAIIGNSIPVLSWVVAYPMIALLPISYWWLVESVRPLVGSSIALVLSIKVYKQISMFSQKNKNLTLLALIISSLSLFNSLLFLFIILMGMISYIGR